jgi:hypothetical protein
MGSEQRIIERGGLGRYRPSPNKKGFLSEAFQSIAGGGLSHTMQFLASPEWPLKSLIILEI